jgi:glycosyltransferase involved in cell wall biosynthesis
VGGTRHHPLVTVVVPTIDGREHWLEKARASVDATVPKYEWLEYRNLPTCGVGWNYGITAAKGDYILLFADDLEAHPGCLEAAISAVKSGVIPCARILNPDGSLQSCGTFAEEADDGTPSVVARIPFLTRNMAEAMFPLMENHYMGDHWITWKGKQFGWPTLVVRDMVFTHHFAQEGRIDSLASDVKAYHRATK